MKKIIYVRPVDETTWRLLEELARDTGRPVSGLVLEAVYDLLWRYQKYELGTEGSDKQPCVRCGR